MTNHACPKCGHPPIKSPNEEVWCGVCGFNAEALWYWKMAILRDLAEQALALRAHTVLADGSWLPLPDAQKMVLRDYAALAANPLRLPGEDAT